MWTLPLPLPLPVLVLGVAIAGLIAAIFLPVSKTAKKPAPFKASSKPPGIYTLAEIAKHNTRDDCWIIIKGKVYDVTAHVEEHPGGDAILNHAGGDSTEGFFGPQHATRVFDMVEEFYIGELDNVSYTH